MYMHWVGILCFLFFATPLASAPVKVSYLPSVPVVQTSEVSIDINESLPLLHLASKAQQVLKIELTVSPQPGISRLAQTPIELTLVLKDIFVNLFVNQEEAAFDPRGDRSAISLKEFSRLIDKPIRLKIDEKGSIIDVSGDMQKVKRELPALTDLGIEILFGELLQHHFTVLGKDLALGTKFQVPFAHEPVSPLPETVEYEIISITDKDVVAAIKGEIKPRQIELKTPMLLNEKEEKVQLTFSGFLKGEGSWNRNNAMFFSLKNDYTYNALLKTSDKQWKMQITLSHKLTSNKS